MKKLAVLALLLLLAACNNPPAPAPEEKAEVEFSTGLIKDPNRAYGVLHFTPKGLKGQDRAPESFDWEEKGFATPVRNQANCGSCWAFGGTQTIEMAYKIFAQKEIDFSEQELVSKLYYGCGGGYFTGEYQVSKGQTDEAQCPYTASNKKCPGTPKPVGKGSSWGLVGQPNKIPSDEELQNAIQSYGALSVTVCANGSFMNYKGGLAPNGPKCSTNHIVALVGWKTVNGKVYYKLKNSWGKGWGEAGYGWFQRLSYNLAEEASWLAIDAVPCKPPALKLPSEYVVSYGDEVLLAAKNIQGVTYAWYSGSQKLSDAPVLEIVAKDSLVLTLKAQNQCGSAEIITRLTVKNKQEEIK